MNTLSFTTSLFTHAFCWALLNSLWQGLLVYGSLYILLKALPGARARVRYNLSFIAFAAVFFWFADTFIVQYQKLKGIIVYITQSSPDATLPVTHAVKTYAQTGTDTHFFSSYLAQLQYYLPVIMAAYTIGLLLMLIRFFVNALQAQALRKRGTVVPDDYWDDMLQVWKDRLGIVRPVKMLFSSAVNVPMMLGVLRPVILLPVATLNHLSMEQVESIVMHELAHIRRHDYLFNLLQSIGEAILFFNPFVWLISSIIRKERELCCDDIVVACSASPLPYARALAVLENVRHNSLALAATGNKHQLFHRIKRIMEMKKKNLSYSQLTVAILIVVIIFTTALFTFTPSMAQKAKAGKSDTTQIKSVYKYKSVTIDSNGRKTVVEEERVSPPAKKHSSRNDDDDDIDISNSTSSKSPQTHAFAYSYSLSDDDSDLNKILEEVHIATKEAMDAASNIHMKDIQEEMKKAQQELSSIDWAGIRNSINEGLDEVNKQLNDPKFRKELNDNLKKELERSKEALENARDQIKTQLREHSAHAYASGVSINADKISIDNNDFESMLKIMERDGLIDRSKSYHVEKSNEKLYINGNLQPGNVYNKYQNYLQNKSVDIKGKKGALTIKVND